MSGIGANVAVELNRALALVDADAPAWVHAALQTDCGIDPRAARVPKSVHAREVPALFGRHTGRTFVRAGALWYDVALLARVNAVCDRAVYPATAQPDFRLADFWAKRILVVDAADLDAVVAAIRAHSGGARPATINGVPQ